MADRVRAERPRESSLIGNVTKAPTQLADFALAPSTRDAYGRVARGFDEWLGGRPATDAALADYLGALFDRGLAAASAETAVAAVRDRARREGTACPAGKLTRQALCGYRRAGAGRGSGQVDGISWEQADRMAELAEGRGTGGLRDALLVRLMSDCRCAAPRRWRSTRRTSPSRTAGCAWRCGAARPTRRAGASCSMRALRRRGWHGAG